MMPDNQFFNLYFGIIDHIFKIFFPRHNIQKIFSIDGDNYIITLHKINFIFRLCQKHLKNNRLSNTFALIALSDFALYRLSDYIACQCVGIPHLACSGQNLPHRFQRDKIRCHPLRHISEPQTFYPLYRCSGASHVFTEYEKHGRGGF